VGNAMAANPISIIVPCHRIIGSGGELVGYGGGLPLKRKLLTLEQRNASTLGALNTDARYVGDSRPLCKDDTE
jgi:methylated-DNA-[protein]-cysteine S-methyltransferase